MARSPESVLVQEPVVEAAGGFRVALANFEGPFDLLLSLIAKQQVDITEIALSAVTDEFLSYLHGIDTLEGLDRASEFLVVAATLLDLKIAGLLPQGELVDAEDAALLEARDLLFARLLQYRAFKQVSSWFAERIEIETSRHVRDVPLEEEYRARKPELVWTLSAEDFGALAAFALAPREIPTVGLDHLHAPLISIREQAAYVVAVLRERSTATFRELIATAEEKGVIVARFIAVLELYRHAAVAFEQPEPLGELTLQWVAPSWSDANLAHLGADYDG
ncbi:chromosome segregation protein ScpA [Rathayibacter sp. Leaf299]|uniref:segregation and condensation protein A n=1 Tax=Rathayibacter sp. Leaf299 TaxID=1736328 RepID=UPI0006F8E5B5|nr:ScpA family protein [Rathayibacter sp. Leaf299]KQQ18348.1 chromosome segregation protein ScpA [Rathayibacter sp. Leaf299]